MVFYAVTLALIAFCCSFCLSNKIFSLFQQAWARDEALARERVIANGGETEFGKYYNKYEFEYSEDATESDSPVSKEE
jgi:hypothetical protein